MLARLSDYLGLSLDELQALDGRLDPDVRAWIDSNPEVAHLVRTIMASDDAPHLIRRLRGIAEASLQDETRPQLLTWESEVLAIQREAVSWEIETGGDLFGVWDPDPIIYLATKAGPDAKREQSHFRLDVDYLKDLSDNLATQWGLRYFGDWHSHHRLGLREPSSGDQKRLRRLAKKNDFHAMAEIIVTIEGELGDAATTHLNSWIYTNHEDNEPPEQAQLVVIPGTSPMREILINREALPEQDLENWKETSLETLRIGHTHLPPTVGAPLPVPKDLRDRALAEMRFGLEAATQNEVEVQVTSFGHIFAVPAGPDTLIAFAIEDSWPPTILEVDHVDRRMSKAIPIEGLKLPARVSSGDELIDIYRQALSRKVTDHVDG